MADDASDTLSGGTKNYLGAVAFTMVLAGGEELFRELLTGSATSPWWSSAIVIALAYPVYVSPAIWKWWNEDRGEVPTGHDLRTAAPELPPPPPSTGALHRDIWLHDAIWRLYLGRWERRTIDRDGTGYSHEEIERLQKCFKEIRQAAFDGRLPVWGKLGPVGNLWQQIPQEAWATGNADWFSFVGHGPEDLWMAASARSGLEGPKGRGNWSELKTSRAAVDAIWPPHTPQPAQPLGKTEKKTAENLAEAARDKEKRLLLKEQRANFDPIKQAFDERRLEQYRMLLKGRRSDLKLSVGEDGKYFATKSGTQRIRRTLNLCCENYPDQKLTGCKITLTAIDPPPDNNVLPWVIEESFDLAPGDHKYIPLVSYGEPGTPYAKGETFIEVLPARVSPTLPIAVPHILSIRATSLDTRPFDFRCKVWIDENGRLHIEEAK